MAEAHPVGFQYVVEAKKRGAKVIHVDPRFTRTSALAHTYVPVRAGADIAFLGGIVNYILSNELDFREYVLAYTNASTLVSEEFRDTEDLDGLFSGYDPETNTYDQSSWQYAGQQHEGQDEDESHADRETASGLEQESHGPPVPADVPRDPTLQDPRCVYQILKRHYARYTPEVVEQVCGVPPDKFLEVCEAWTRNSGRERTTALVYSVGWTQHSVGVQYIRTGAIIQLLLGNMGRPGGGVMALRGHASIQGSTDIPTLFNLLPGYLPMPHHRQHETFRQWVDAIRHPEQKGFWANAEAYAVSLLKAYWGDAATADNDWAYGYLPRLTGDHGTYQQVLEHDRRQDQGVLPARPEPGRGLGARQGAAPRHGQPGLAGRARPVPDRERHLLEGRPGGRDRRDRARASAGPRCSSCRPPRTWRRKARSPRPSGCCSGARRPSSRRATAAPSCGSSTTSAGSSGSGWPAPTDRRDRPILDLTWDYPLHGERGDEPSARGRAQGDQRLRRGHRPRRCPTSPRLKPDGSTACGCWIYSGVYKDGVNQSARRKPGSEQDWVAREWGWVWPADRRTLYNRASADPEGRPWSERKKYVWWDPEAGDAGEWTGYDVPDFEKTKPPSYRPPEGATGVAAISGDDAFIMQGDGKGWLYAPSGLIDGPLPTHYEPAESPVRNPLYQQQANPTRKVYERSGQPDQPEPARAARRGLPVRVHHQPAHRAPHRRRR